MPRVPRFEPRVQTQAMSAPRARGVGADAFGAGLARGLGQVAGDVERIAEDQDSTVVNSEFAAYDAWKVKALHDDETGLLPTNRGEKAVTPVNGQTLEQRAIDLRRQYLAEAEKRLTSERQRTLFKRYIEKDEAEFLGSVNRWETQERKAYQTATDTAAVENMREAVYAIGAKAEFDPDLFNANIAKLTDRIKVKYAREGYGPDSELVQQAIQSAVSDARAARVRSLIDSGRDREAVDYFETVELDAADRAKLEPTVTKIKEVNNGEDAAVSAFDKRRPKTINDLLDVAGMREDIDASSLTDTEKDYARRKVQELTSQYLQEKRLGEEAAAQRIYGMAVNEKRSYSQVVKAIEASPELDNISKANIMQWADSHYRISEGLAEARADERLRQQTEQLANLMRFRETIVTTGVVPSIEEVQGMAPQFGAFTDDAMRMVDDIRNAPADAKITDPEIDDAITLLRANDQYRGLIPSPTSKDATDKAKLVLLKNKVTELIALSAKGQKGPNAKVMTTQEALRKALQTYETDAGRKFLGFSFGRDKDPLYLLGTDLTDRHPSLWPKATQDKVIDEMWAADARNKGRTMTPQQREALRAQLLK